MKSKSNLVNKNITIKQALKILNNSPEKVLLIVDDAHKLLGAVTDGDIRRYLMKGKKISNKISNFYNRKPIFIKKKDYSLDRIKEMHLKHKIGAIPIVDDERKVVDVSGWSDVFSGAHLPKFTSKELRVPVVLMAGGKGTRLVPFTIMLPKPLVPMGEKSISEHIIEQFHSQGSRKFYMILNYKSEIVESYFNHIKKNYVIEFIREEKQLGTAGGLKKIQKCLKNDFIVSNCDVLVKADFVEVVKFHKESRAALTVLSSIQHHKIPYGIVHFKNGGTVNRLVEKPEYTFTINTGVYILNKEALKFIPSSKYFDMPDLISALIEKGKKVLTYPVNESDYTDIGQLEEYKKVINELKCV